jgi:hypothetical protein
LNVIKGERASERASERERERERERAFILDVFHNGGQDAEEVEGRRRGGEEERRGRGGVVYF